MVRYGDWKLVISKGELIKGRGMQALSAELFNLATDLGETRNLAAENPEMLAGMKKHLAEISARDNDAAAKDQ